VNLDGMQLIPDGGDAYVTTRVNAFLEKCWAANQRFESLNI
jgi:hypothetical protein